METSDYMEIFQARPYRVNKKDPGATDRCLVSPHLSLVNHVI